jgi:small subunit ribosomal protein S20
LRNYVINLINKSTDFCKILTSLPYFALPPKKALRVKKGKKMANHKATKKDARQAAKRTERNKYYGKTTRNAIRDLKELKGAEMGKKFPDVAAMIDKLAKRGVIHKNKAANLKSKLAKKANAAAK